MNRIVILVEPASPEGVLLACATLEAAARHPQFEVAAVVDGGRRRRHGLLSMARALRAAQPVSGDAGTLRRAARTHRVALLTPPGHDPNDPRFVARLQGELRPTVLMSFYCLQILKPELLASAACCVNYHNGYLPDYRGRRATCWSLYNGEQRSGFAFHYMTAGIDEGNVLITDGVPIRAADPVQAIERDKALAAAGRVGELLDLIATRAIGAPQTGAAHYYALRDAAALVECQSPGALTSSELRRRLRAFGALRLTLDGRARWVTELETADPGQTQAEATFRCADGVVLRARPAPRRRSEWRRRLGGLVRGNAR